MNETPTPVINLSPEEQVVFDALYEKYSEMIVRFAYRETHSRQDAEEIMQDTFFTLSQNISTVMTYERPNRWLLKTAGNHLKHYFRSQKDRRLEYALEDLLGPQEPRTVEHGYSEVELSELDKEAPPWLNEQDKRLLALRASGYNLKEISAKLKITYDTCRRRSSRTINKLSEWLKDKK